MIRIVSLVMVAFLALAATAFAAPPRLDAKRLRAIVEDASKQAGTQGVLFGVWVGDRPVLVTALGHSMTTVPASPRMHWRIGGISETFLTTLTMMLADRGLINLDEKISRWYPGMLNADKATVRMLVSNRAGYVDYVYVQEFDDFVTREPFHQFSAADLIAYSLKGGKANFEPGTSQAYSHTEYVMLGPILEKATGQSLQSLFDQYIFKPLGLKNTRVMSNQEIVPPVLHAFSSDRGVYEDSTYWNPSWTGATGALMSNLRDIGKWGPIFGTGRLLKPATWKEMHAPTSVGMGKNRKDAYFGYGFIVTNGWYVQNPSFNGFTGAFGYDPETNVTIVVAATKKPKPAIDPAGIHILRQVIKHVTPDRPLGF